MGADDATASGGLQPDVFEIESGTRLAEIDMWVIVDGRIIIGEAKTIDRLGESATEENQSISGLLRLGEGLTADEVVFATTEKWKETTKNRVNRIFGKSRVRPRFLERLGS